MKIATHPLVTSFFVILVMINGGSARPSRDNSSGSKAKSTCSRPSSVEITELLSNEVSSNDITILNYHFSCLAVRAFGLFNSLAVMVKYSTTEEQEKTLQIVMDCGENNQWTVDGGQTVLGVDMSVLPSTQYHCYKCVSSKPDGGPGSDNGWDNDTWCLECSENCQKMGGGFCVSPSEYSCCPYFDKLEGVCVDECDSRVNSSNHCTDECTGNWTGDDCDMCPLDCFNGGSHDSECQMCVCMEGYTGNRCEGVVPCNASYCLNGGEPDPINCTRCICLSGYEGDRCERNTDPCTNHTCLNGGTCIVGDTGNPSCVCPDGWTGEYCDIETDDCSDQDYCKNGGVCIRIDTDDIVCNCTTTNHTGPTCEDENNDEDFCDKHPDHCLNGGTCISEGQCLCPDEYTGPHCEDRVDECPCLNGGSCEALEGQTVCFCPDEYIGPLCQYPNPCIPNPCLNGGTCAVDRGNYNSFTCTCVGSWSGDVCDLCLETGDVNDDCTVQPTEELSIESTSNNKIGLIIGIVFAAIMMALLLGSLLLLGVIIYRRMGPASEKSAEVDNGAFEGSKVMVNPVFIRPDDLSMSMDESIKTKI